jgi:hypothetical protein
LTIFGARDEGDEGVLHGRIRHSVGAKACPHVFRGSFCEDLPLCYDHEITSRSQYLAFFHEVGGDHDRDAVFREQVDLAPEISPPERINP